MAAVKITCPSCDASFKVKAEALQPEGRKVKCARCAHKWFQEPVDDDGADAPAKPKPKKRKKKPAGEEGGAPKKRRVKKKAPPPPPEPEDDEPEEEAPEDEGYEEVAGYDAAASAAADEATGAATDDIPIPPLMEKPPKKSKFSGKNIVMALWGVLGVLVVAVVVAFFALSESLLDQFPDLEGIYKTVGLAPDDGGKRLLIKNMTTDFEFDREKKVRVLVVKADIINPNAGRMKEIPPVVIILKNSDGVRVSSWVHRMTNPSIGKGAVVEMIAKKPNPHSEARKVELQFQPNLPNEPGN